MATLTKKQKARLVTLINGVQVWSQIQHEAVATGDTDNYEIARSAWARDMIALADEFGIELPNLPSAKKEAGL